MSAFNNPPILEYRNALIEAATIAVDRALALDGNGVALLQHQCDNPHCLLSSGFFIQCVIKPELVRECFRQLHRNDVDLRRYAVEPLSDPDRYTESPADPRPGSGANHDRSIPPLLINSILLREEQ